MQLINTALTNAKELHPICIPSYKRWERKQNKTLSLIIANCSEEIQSNTYVFVRKEQKKLYENNFGDLKINFVELPEVNGLADTRQFICDYVTDVLHQDYFLDMDDDITDLKYIEIRDNKISLSLKDTKVYDQIIKLGFEISKLAFEEYNCIMGNMVRVRFANRIDNLDNAFTTNKGATPRQVMYINAKKLRELKIKRNPIFNPTGDDMGFVAEICKKNGDLFNINCLAYSFVDDAVNSVIRNDDNRKQLANYEYECLKKYPIKYYLRIPFTFDDGSYKFSDIDFTKYRNIFKKKTQTIKLGVLCKKNNWK